MDTELRQEIINTLNSIKKEIVKRNVNKKQYKSI